MHATLDTLSPHAAASRGVIDPRVARASALLVAATITACTAVWPNAASTLPDHRNPEPVLFTELLATSPEAPSTGSGGPGPVVFLPGYGATTGYFRDRIALASPRRPLLAVDLLGFGRSPTPDGRYTVDAHLGALRRTLAGRGRVVLVGHSFGARLAVSYAARYPADVDALVLLALPTIRTRPDATGRGSTSADAAGSPARSGPAAG